MAAILSLNGVQLGSNYLENVGECGVSISRTAAAEQVLARARNAEEVNLGLVVRGAKAQAVVWTR